MAARPVDAIAAPRFEQVLQVRTEGQQPVATNRALDPAGSVVPAAPVSEMVQPAAVAVVRHGAIVPDRVFRFDALGLLHVRELAAREALQDGGTTTQTSADCPATRDLRLVGEEGAVLPPDLAVSCAWPDQDDAAGLAPGSGAGSVPGINAAFLDWDGLAGLAEASGKGAMQLLLEIGPTGKGLPEVMPLFARESAGTPQSRSAGARSEITRPFRFATQSGSATPLDITVMLEGGEVASVAIGIPAAGDEDASLVAQVRQLLARYGLVAGKIVIAGRTVSSEEQPRGEEPWL